MPKRRDVEHHRNAAGDPANPEEQRLRAIDVCTAILAQSQGKAFGLDGDPRFRATWWVDYMMEPPNYPSERPMRTAPGNSNDGGLVEPYPGRIAYCLKRYLCFSEDDQRYIVAAREDNIRWRGDEMEFFCMIAESTRA